MNTDRDLCWDGCVNVRDLGGLGSIRRGALVRMEAPTYLTPQGWAAAYDHGVRTILDLRNLTEGDPDLTPRPAEITLVHTPLDPVGTPFYERWLKIDGLGTPLHYQALLAEHPERVVAALRAIADAAPGCVAFHCAGGKDRTGLLALILLTLAGATPDEIIADHLLTYDRMKQRYLDHGAGDQRALTTKILAQHNTTIEATLTATITSLPLPDLLLSHGLTQPELTRLTTRLTT
ncbi:tyrosine-protein phosphatase [Actinocorallia lasiicapitis]